MFEFLYTFFLLRFSSQLLYKAVKTPEGFARMLRVWLFIVLGIYGLFLYGVMAGKNVQPSEFWTVISAFPVVFGWGFVIWEGAKKLATIPQEEYDTMHNFKAVGRGFMGVTVFFILFASLNMIFGVMWLLGAMVWLLTIIASLGLALTSKEFTFESFTYIPTIFFTFEEKIFSFLGLNIIVFGFTLLGVVLLLPFLLAGWVLWGQTKTTA
ncbi:MAG: hypothetical protein EAZ95_13945 [Bacteroidetes bacterium]|nr:MAG: hypothetical protein EAZ95_13945 [Bacteroidota bacterium]